MRRLLFLFLFFIVPLGVGLAQNAEISGIVTDSTKAVIPNASVVITHQATGTKITTVTNGVGYYFAPSLVSGKYSVAVSAPGFETITRDDITVLVNQPLRVDFELRPGSTTQTIEVHAEVAALNSEQVEFGTDIDNTMDKELPLSLSGGLVGQALRRQIENFMFLVPGATGAGFSHRLSGGVDFSNEVYYNGVPFVFSETQGWQDNSNPPYESVNEFKVVTSVFTAQWGHGQGIASYNFTSGTNALHGELHELFRNNIMDARPFYSPVVDLNRQNEFGFTAGGPIWIPKVYDGRNKTFFNFAWNTFFYRGAPLTGLYTMPTMAMRQGDFSGLVDSSGNMVPICDPVTGTQFPGNIIPAARLSSVAKQLVTLLPPTEFSGLINNTPYGITSLPINDYTWSLRADQYIRDRHRLSFTVWKDYDHKTATGVSALAGPLGDYRTYYERELGGVANYTFTIKPNLVMTAGWSVNGSLNPTTITAKNPSLSIPGTPVGSFFPQYAFSGPLDATQTFGQGLWGNMNRKLGFAVVENFAWVKGRHNFNIGFELRRPYQHNTQGGPQDFNFSNLTTSLPGSPNFAEDGFAFASFMLGLADSATLGNQWAVQPRSWYAAEYIQDDFKVTPKLTLNLGLRYDQYRPFRERNEYIAYFNPSIPNPAAGDIPGGLMKLGTCPSGCADTDQIVSTRWHYIAPRIGLAYRLGEKTVLRAGYGIIYMNGGASEFGTNKVVQGFVNGLVGEASYISPNSGITPGYGSIDQPYPALVASGILPNGGFNPSSGNGQTLNYLAPYNGQVPTLYNYTAGVQRQVAGSIILSASWIGNHAVRVPSQLQNLDQVNPSYLSLGPVLLDDINSPQAAAAGIKPPYPGFTGSVAGGLRPYPQYASIESNFDECGSVVYNALQLTAQKRFSQGLTFLVSYTAAHMHSNTSSGFSTFNGFPLNTFDRKAEWSTDPNVVPQALTLSGIYELPIGPGKKLVNSKGVVGQILGGWQVGWIMSYQHGSPIGFGASNVLPLYNGGNRPNVVSGVNPCNSKSGFDPAVDREFNLAAFSQPADYTFGNAPRVTGGCFGFPYYDEDYNLNKHFKITEKVVFELRLEYFNTFNRVQFSNGNTGYSPGSSSFGAVSSQSNLPRTGQITLKLNF